MCTRPLSPPQLRLPRAVVDAASRATRPDDVRALLCAGVQQRRLRAEDLRDVVLRLGPVRNRALLLRTLDDVEAGSHSVRELQFVRTVRRAGLPAPERQVVRRRAGGRFYLDAAWDAYSLHVEVDGLGHLLVGAWAADADRANELALRRSSATTLRIPASGWTSGGSTWWTRCGAGCCPAAGRRLVAEMW
jgi:hypothetical protein